MSSAKVGRYWNVIRLILATGILINAVFAQSPRATLRGRVLDPAGAPVAGARVTATPEGGTVGSSTATGPTGDFAIDLPVNSYSLNSS